MDKKKTAFIILGVTVLMLIVVFVVLSANKKSIDTQTPADTSQGNSNNPTPTKTAPVTTKPNPSSIQTQGNTEYIIISNPSDKNDIDNAFNKFVQEQPKDIGWATLSDSSKKSISLDNFSASTGFNVIPDLRTVLDTSKFNLLSCSSETSSKSIGLALNIKLLPNYKGNLYQDELRMMKKWEGTMFQDTRNVLFPGTNFSPELLAQKPVFKDGKYRYAEIVLPNNQKSSINYSIIDDYIIITNSLDCLDKASKELVSSDH